MYFSPSVKPMDLAHAMRLIRSTNPQPERVIAFVGAGGKTAAMFQLARSIALTRKLSVIVTTTSHLGIWQAQLADRHIIPAGEKELGLVFEDVITLFTGAVEGERLLPLHPDLLHRLNEICETQNLPLLIEADGSRQMPIKAPAEHEPPIPDFAEVVVVTTGLSGLGQPNTSSHVHRPEVFGRLSGLEQGERITEEALGRVLKHPKGGLKNIPGRARRIALLNQAETPESMSAGGRLALSLTDVYHSALVGSLNEKRFQTFERTAAIILAAGGSERLGRPKQVLDWRGEPFVRAVARTALAAGSNPVLVVTGAFDDVTRQALNGLPVQVVHNPGWREGQASSIRAGLQALADGDLRIGSAIFLLVDQPQVNVSILHALMEIHSVSLPAILAPMVIDQRANPVLFDRVTFPDLMQLQGDTGGRGIFHKHQIEYLPWHDDRLLLDVDTPEQYTRLIEDESL